MTPGVSRVRPAAALALVSMAQFLIALDYSIIYVALPSIARDLRFGPSVAPWIVNAYAIFFAGFLLLGGRLSDRLGAARLFTLAVLVFGAASVAGGLTPNAGVLLVARAVQGIGAALLQPAILGLIGTQFPDGLMRDRAYAVWGSVGALGLAAGVILGGALTSASWRLTFIINVPLCGLCAAGAVAFLARGRTIAAGRPIPLVAASLGTAAVLAVVIALTCSADPALRGGPAIGAGSIAALSCILFGIRERTAAHTLIENGLRRAASIRLGAVATAFYMASVGAEFYLVTLLMQTIQGYSALQAGVAFLPLAATIAVGSQAAGHAVRTVPVARVLCGGFTIAALGLAWLALTVHGHSYAADLLPGFVLSGFGHGVIYTSMFMLGARGVAADQQSTAGALLTTAQYISAAIVVAVLTIVLAAEPSVAGFGTALWITCAAALAGGAVFARG